MNLQQLHEVRRANDQYAILRNPDLSDTEKHFINFLFKNTDAPASLQRMNYSGGVMNLFNIGPFSIRWDLAYTRRVHKMWKEYQENNSAKFKKEFEHFLGDHLRRTLKRGLLPDSIQYEPNNPLDEAQYYQARTFKRLVRFFEKRSNRYYVRPEFTVTYPYEREEDYLPVITHLIMDPTGVWAEYADANGDWTTEEHLAKHVKVHDKKGKQVF